MSDRLDLHVLLADPERALNLAPELVSAVLRDVAMQEAQLATLRSLLAARLTSDLRARDEVRPPYTLTEAAARVRKSPVWLRRQAKRDRVPGAHNSGKSWVFDRASFERWCRRPDVD